MKLKEAITDVSKAQEKLINKRSMALQKRDSSLKKIQVGGTAQLLMLGRLAGHSERV